MFSIVISGRNRWFHSFPSPNSPEFPNSERPPRSQPRRETKNMNGPLRAAGIGVAAGAGIAAALAANDSWWALAAVSLCLPITFLSVLRTTSRPSGSEPLQVKLLAIGLLFLQWPITLAVGASSATLTSRLHMPVEIGFWFAVLLGFLAFAACLLGVALIVVENCYTRPMIAWMFLGVGAIISTALINSLAAALRRRESYLYPDVQSAYQENPGTYLFIILWLFLVTGSHVALCISTRDDQGKSGR